MGNPFRHLSLFLVLMVVGCAGPNSTSSPGGGGNPVPDLGKLVSTVTDHSKGMSVSTLKLSSGSSGKALFANQSITTLSTLDSKNSVVPLTFSTTNGETVILNLTRLKKLNSDFVLARFSGVVSVSVGSDTSAYTFVQNYPVVGNCLVNLQSGVAYDLSTFDADNAIVYGGMVYITNGHTLYKIDLSTVDLAEPLNNPDFDPCGPLDYVLDGKVLSGNTAFDINGTVIPKTVKSVAVPEHPELGIVTVNSGNDGIVLDGEGAHWGFRRIGGNQLDYYKLHIDVNGNSQVSDIATYSLPFNTTSYPGNELRTFLIDDLNNFGARYLVCGVGYAKITSTSGPGISIESSSLDFSSIDFPAAYQYPLLIGDKIYWNTSNFNSIICLDIKNNSLTTIYQNPNLLNSPLSLISGQSPMLSYIGDTLIFYQHISATEVGTYSLVLGESVPSLIASSKIDNYSLSQLSF